MPTTPELTELLGMLHNQRETLRVAAKGLTDEQAARQSTVSDLTIGGLLNHVATTEGFWLDVYAERAGGFIFDMDQYKMPAGATLDDLLARYAEVADRTRETLEADPDLDKQVKLPEFPWAPGEPEVWPRRRILFHLLRETAHHCGHADIIREAIDGANTTMQMAALHHGS